MRISWDPLHLDVVVASTSPWQQRLLVKCPSQDDSTGLKVSLMQLNKVAAMLLEPNIFAARRPPRCAACAGGGGPFRF